MGAFTQSAMICFLKLRDFLQPVMTKRAGVYVIVILLLLVSLFQVACSKDRPTKPEPVEGVLRGKVVDQEGRPLAGAHINLGYEFGQLTMPPTYNVKNPSEYFLVGQNYPNPYNPLTNFTFTLNKPARIVITIVPSVYTANVFATLLDESLLAGTYVITWNSKLPDSTFITNGHHTYRFEALDGSAVLFRDERFLFQNSLDPEIVSNMNPMVTANFNGEFTIPYLLTSIGDTVAVTLESGAEIIGGVVVSDSLTVFASLPGYETAMKRALFGENDSPFVNLVLTRKQGIFSK